MARREKDRQTEKQWLTLHTSENWGLGQTTTTKSWKIGGCRELQSQSAQMEKNPIKW